MSEEVSDALHMLLHCSLKDTEYETQKEQFKIVYDYIIDLEKRIDNAKEYIKLNIRDIDYDTEEYDYLMKLLGDKE